MKGGTDWQTAVSLDADLEKHTWTFEMSGNYHVEAGHFALVRYEAFHKQSVLMAQAHGILRDIYKAEGVNKEIMERIESFFDPAPL